MNVTGTYEERRLEVNMDQAGVCYPRMECIIDDTIIATIPAHPLVASLNVDITEADIHVSMTRHVLQLDCTYTFIAQTVEDDITPLHFIKLPVPGRVTSVSVSEPDDLLFKHDSDGHTTHILLSSEVPLVEVEVKLVDLDIATFHWVGDGDPLKFSVFAIEPEPPSSSGRAPLPCLRTFFQDVGLPMSIGCGAGAPAGSAPIISSAQPLYNADVEHPQQQAAYAEEKLTANTDWYDQWTRQHQHRHGPDYDDGYSYDDGRNYDDMLRELASA